MAKESKKVNIIVLKGNRDVEGVAIKQNAMEVVLTFVSKVLDIPLYNGTYIYEIKGLDPNKPGDAQWIKEKVMRKVDIYGTTGSAEALKRAERMVSVYNEVNEGPEKCGIAIIKYFLDQMYMQYDISE